MSWFPLRPSWQPPYQQYNQWTPMHQHQPTNFAPPQFDPNPPAYNQNAVYDDPTNTNPRPQSFASTYKPAPDGTVFEVGEEQANGKVDEPGYRRRTCTQRWFGGLRRSLNAFTALAVLVLIANVSWFLYAKQKYGFSDSGFGTIARGPCPEIKKTNTYLHLAINVMSTLLLTGSNAFMAVYSGPTRKEIDKAHQRRMWLHVGGSIGVSWRNMLGVSWRKTIVVLLLFATSIPFHLLYNSVVFTSLVTNNYYWAVTTNDFLNGQSFDLTGPATVPLYGSEYYSFAANMPDDTPVRSGSDNAADAEVMIQYFESMQKDAPKWERLDQASCIRAYANAFVSMRRNVILISSAQNDTNSILTYGESHVDPPLDGNWWICSERHQDGGNMKCNPQEKVKNASSWEVFDYPIEYCLSQKVEDVCSVQFSRDIMIVMIVFNSIKVVAMLWVLFRFKAEHIIASVGDAVMSFIRMPDPTTVNMCLADRRHVHDYWTDRSRAGYPRVLDLTIRRHWGQALSLMRWAMFFLLMAAAIGAVLFFGAWGFIHTHNRGVSLTPSSLWSLGLGTINQHTMVFYGGAGNAYSMSLVANLPQVVLSVIYLMYMGIVSTMFQAADWAKFAFKPQRLMVSTPRSRQRGTWLLGAPLHYGLILLALQALLHWFVSQSLFLVQIVVYDKLGHPTQGLEHPLLSNCGYSPIAIILAVIASVLLCLTALIFMRRSMPQGAPPVVATCSAAISAACHVPRMMLDDSLVYEKLRWGATDYAPNGTGHCSFGPASAWGSGINEPIGGRWYAGMSKK